MSILLFVCLSLSFGVAQSQLKNNGDRCSLNRECSSGCCSITVSSFNVNKRTCKAFAALDEPCSLTPMDGFYDECPCESGLICKPDWTSSPSCKKPNSK
ncbi:hypothetical protein GDO78_019863 [Eleutherodactylus coqui]|uniref:Colipase C-terminal domain-containing protein n=1 Tax=Eleutherodactylus coqui TaxID=57060 RepID=A0A8J6B7C1_ELECQ|nr:hypothetical protein GDO78_019863 [Eleutherodactylus coqui]